MKWFLIAWEWSGWLDKFILVVYAFPFLAIFSATGVICFFEIIDSLLSRLSMRLFLTLMVGSGRALGQAYRLPERLRLRFQESRKRSWETKEPWE